MFAAVGVAKPIRLLLAPTTFFSLRVFKIATLVKFSPITTVPCRAKDPSLPRVSILCRPHKNGGGAGYRPRVHYAYSINRLSL